jgi:hypothetical protein
MKFVSFSELKPRFGIGLTRRRPRDLVAEGKFPQPVAVSQARIAWLEDEVIAWQETKVKVRLVLDGLSGPDQPRENIGVTSVTNVSPPAVAPASAQSKAKAPERPAPHGRATSKQPVTSTMPLTVRLLSFGIVEVSREASGKLASDGRFQHRPGYGQRARRGAATAFDDRPAALLRLDIRLAIARGNIRLEFGNIARCQREGELAASNGLTWRSIFEQSGRPARCLLVRLSAGPSAR